MVQAPRGDAIDPLLVLVRLLIGDPDQLGHLLLGEPEHDPALAHPRPDMPVDVLRARAAGTGIGARLDHHCRHRLLHPSQLGESLARATSPLGAVAGAVGKPSRGPMPST